MLNQKLTVMEKKRKGIQVYAIIVGIVFIVTLIAIPYMYIGNPFGFLLGICKGGLWICIGVLFGNHLETILSLILRKPIPEGLISPDDIKKTKILFKIMGLIIILIGIGQIIFTLLDLIESI
jgi:hypothetical protein